MLQRLVATVEGPKNVGAVVEKNWITCGTRAKCGINILQRIVKTLKRNQHVAAIAQDIDGIGPDRKRLVEALKGFFMSLQQPQQITMVVERY